jgi:hypothetical protein
MDTPILYFCLCMYTMVTIWVGCFGLKNELVDHLPTPHYFVWFYEMKWVDLSSPHSSQVSTLFLLVYKV